MSSIGEALELHELQQFQKFLKKELDPAIEDIEALDVSRVHVQKLVYTNLVDRFDSLIDRVILDSCRSPGVLEEALKGEESQVTEADLIKMLLELHTLEDALVSKVKDRLNSRVLSRRHSRKLNFLLSLCSTPGNFEQKPRVNASTGEILAQIKPVNSSPPLSICGFADYLYSRRNALVHGAGRSTYLDNDRRQVKKLFRVDLPKTFRIKVGSIELARNFYGSVCDLIYSTS